MTPVPRRQRGPRRGAFRRFLDAATDRYGIVLMLILVTYVLASVLPEGPGSSALLSLAAGITAVVTLSASDAPVRRRRAASAATAVAVVTAAVSRVIDAHGIPELIAALLLVWSLGSIVQRIVRHQRVSAQTLMGAVCCYVLFGLIYTFIYAAIDRFGSAPFLSPPGSTSLSDYLFFSFTTLTTTGYGDLVPATGLGRALAMLEALTGQLYLVTVVARLVALWIPRRPVLRDQDTGTADHQ